LHKSMLQVWLRCPLQFKLLFLDRKPQEVSFEMQLGTMFHDFARDFFDYVDLETAAQCKTVQEVGKLFGKLVLPEFPPVFKQLCLNFTQFEAARYWTLRGKGRLDLYLPVAKELSVTVPEKMMSGIIDRVDKMIDDTLCIVEYKTGRPQIRSVQRELAFYKIMLDAAQLFDLPIEWLAIYNPNEQKFFVRRFSTQLLNATRRRIDQFWRAMQRKQFEPKPGFHCTWCPVKAICKEIVGGEDNEDDVNDTSSR